MKRTKAELEAQIERAERTLRHFSPNTEIYSKTWRLQARAKAELGRILRQEARS